MIEDIASTYHEVSTVSTTGHPHFIHTSTGSAATADVAGEWHEIDGERSYRISHADRIPVFLMSIVSASDHWMFIASNGGITAGRRNADNALFPYETEDKVAAHRSINGGVSVVRLRDGDRPAVWEPFADARARRYRVDRHLSKNAAGTALILEEINRDLRLRFSVRWETGERFGFIRSCELENLGRDDREIHLLDGMQNLLPPGATQKLQTEMSSLLDAYKRNELDAASGLGIFSLSATLTDRAEPSESLRATLAWQTGLEPDATLLSARQLPAFFAGDDPDTEEDLRGAAGSYIVTSRVRLSAASTLRWRVVAEVNQDGAAVNDLCELLGRTPTDQLNHMLDADIAANRDALYRRIAATDGLQTGADEPTVAHHLANVMFNIMRGGLPADGYRIQRDDLIEFVGTRNREVRRSCAEWLYSLPEQLSLPDLHSRVSEHASADLRRICLEYLPLTFSRRHGDPSRPWNRFSIDLRQEDGRQRLSYQGNWRDIFQNWEPLVLSFPSLNPGVIATFLNATTIDGYNPYRVTRDGIEWEVPEPDNPWSNIGYWNDHQIIYLLKLLEHEEAQCPGRLRAGKGEHRYASARVPYRIRPYEQILSDWYNTIEFDESLHRPIMEEETRIGSDARLHRDESGSVVHISLLEKLLVLLLAKLTNLVPGGGIWMNTQRPEWNDANNALAGKGLSVVTTAYLYRYVAFMRRSLVGDSDAPVACTPALVELLEGTLEVLRASPAGADRPADDRERRRFMDAMGEVATRYRARAYRDGVTVPDRQLSPEAVSELLDLSTVHLEQTLWAGLRPDGLYDAYNVLSVAEGRASVERLYPMLEGQVAIISSGLLDGEQTLDLLRAMRASALYREDQHSYMLYPQRHLVGFREKNSVPSRTAQGIGLVTLMLEREDRRLLTPDTGGTLHFNGNFRNAADLDRLLGELAQEQTYAEAVREDRDRIHELFEDIFNHRSFTGRSGTFFAFEGLGSIYWHMVSKLMLAVQEQYQATQSEQLAAAYHDIRSGLGFNKQPADYGAFPTDPYSHTPWGSGARQPGMTGQVKEEILTRWGELGVTVVGGCIGFQPRLLPRGEFSGSARIHRYLDLNGGWKRLELPAESLAFSYCQTPVVYTLSDHPELTVTMEDGGTRRVAGSRLDRETSETILRRSGKVSMVSVSVPARTVGAGTRLQDAGE